MDYRLSCYEVTRIRLSCSHDIRFIKVTEVEENESSERLLGAKMC